MVVADYVQAGELVGKCASLSSRGLGFVDAALVAVAERLGVGQVITIDRRDLRIVRPRHCDAFELLPDDLRAPI